MSRWLATVTACMLFPAPAGAQLYFSQNARVGVAAARRTERPLMVYIRDRSRIGEIEFVKALVEANAAAMQNRSHRAVGEETQGSVPLGYDAMVSASWELSIGKRVDLRAGLGWSSLPGAWLLQSTDLSVRLGGVKTRGS